MPTYTIEFWRVLELAPEIETEILANYPLFDESHRGGPEGLNQKIKDHFWNQEIGQETISMFRLALRRKLNEIMPIMNKQYEISAIKFNQLETVRVNNANISKNSTTSNGESASDSSTDAKSRAVSQQLPQTLLSGNGDYATAAQDNISDTTAASTANESSTMNQDGTTDNTTAGFQGNAAMLLLQYRQSLVDVDMMILDELQTLFMLIWANGDEFTESSNGYGYFGYYPFPL